MNIFISSLITGMEAYRAAARKIVTNLRHAPVMAEDFGARPQTPQVACLSEIRRADVVVLLIGERYGAVQQSGQSATHEEYVAARADEKPVLVFRQSGVTLDPQQDAFCKDVGSWQNGLFFEQFESPDDLERVLTRALIDYEHSQAAGPIDEAELRNRSQALLPSLRNSSTCTNVAIALAGGPKRQILRPSQLEDPNLVDDLHREALFGSKPVFDHRLGVQRAIETDALVLSQDSEESHIHVDGLRRSPRARSLAR